MKNAKISEIFLSLQGEGLYAGKRQIFVRFHGCNILCDFCDTRMDSFKAFTKDALMSKILEYPEPYHSVSLTGGEPLIQAGFIRDFLMEYNRFYKKPIYLETNGIMHEALSKVLDFVSIIAMDFKLPSSTGKKTFWDDHKKFLKLAKKKEVFVKAVITKNTNSEDIARMAKIVKDVDFSIPIVLQPVTSEDETTLSERDTVWNFKKYIEKQRQRVEVIPQMQKDWGVR